MTDETPAPDTRTAAEPLSADEEDWVRRRDDSGQPLDAFDYHHKRGSDADWRMARIYVEETARDRARLLATLDATRARSIPDDRLREAARAYLDAEDEPAYSWVIESQAARDLGRPNREVERMDRIAKARAALRATLASDATPSTGLDAAWAEAEAAIGTDAVNYVRHDRWDLSVHREYTSDLTKPYQYVAYATQPGIGRISSGEGSPSPAAALRALAAALSASPTETP